MSLKSRALITLNILLGIALVRYFEKLGISYHGEIPNVNVPTLCGIVLYLTSQFIKGIRLYIIANRFDHSILNFCEKFYVINAVSIILPFKLGEIFRIFYMRRDFGGADFSSIALLVERIFDLTFLALCLFFSYLFSSNRIDSSFISGLIIILTITLTLFFSIEQILKLLQISTSKRLNIKRSAKLFRYAGVIIASYSRIRSITDNKKKALFSLTVIIWSLEITAISIVSSGFPVKMNGLLLGEFVTLSAILPSGPAGYGGIQLAIYWYNIITLNSVSPSQAWVQIISLFLSGVLVGFIIHLQGLFKNVLR